MIEEKFPLNVDVNEKFMGDFLSHMCVIVEWK